MTSPNCRSHAAYSSAFQHSISSRAHAVASASLSGHPVDIVVGGDDDPTLRVTFSNFPRHGGDVRVSDLDLAVVVGVDQLRDPENLRERIVLRIGVSRMTITARRPGAGGRRGTCRRPFLGRRVAGRPAAQW